ncbi:MAG: caspase domain-containing protein, partial [Rubrivivax sp.]
MRGVRSLARLLLVGMGLLLGPGQGAWASECPERFRLTFADGSAGCLTDYALADRSPVGWIGSIRRIAPGTGSFNIAASPPGGSCPTALGYAESQLLPSQRANYDSPAARTERALRSCQATVAAAGPAAAGCRCSLLVEDGLSPLTRAQWEPWRSATVATAGPTATPATAVPAPAQPAPVQPAPVQPAAVSPPAQTAAAAGPRPAAGTDPAAGPSVAELAALRQQIEALRAEMVRNADNRPPPPAAPPRKLLRARALVIGNGAYASLGALPNPRNDAQAVAAKLRSFGIDVDLALDTSRAALVKALADYQDRAAGYDVNLLFYAGHGVQMAGINYIVPVDLPAAGATVGSVKLNAVALNDALEYLPARTRLVFLDACRDNPLSRSLMATRSAALGLAPVSTVSGTLVAYATKDGSTAEDGSGRNSPYTTALLEHLDLEEDIAVVLRRVRQSVLKATNQRQEPWEYGSLIGDQLVLSRLAR